MFNKKNDVWGRGMAPRAGQGANSYGTIKGHHAPRIMNQVLGPPPIPISLICVYGWTLCPYFDALIMFYRVLNRVLCVIVCILVFLIKV